jgi:phosphohistidine phosphatase SixA
LASVVIVRKISGGAVRNQVLALCAALAGIAVMTTDTGAQMLAGQELIAALRGGGHVIVMRHASAPRQVPAKETANPDNVTLERQLDAAGRAGATAMGEALRRLKIPIGDVMSSPTYRARETARYAGLPAARTYDELGDGGQSMQAAAEKQGAWLRQQAAELPRGRNTVIVTHMPNIARAFPDLADVADGEALVFGRDEKGAARLVARIPIERWAGLK